MSTALLGFVRKQMQSGHLWGFADLRIGIVAAFVQSLFPRSSSNRFRIQSRQTAAADVRVKISRSPRPSPARPSLRNAWSAPTPVSRADDAAQSTGPVAPQASWRQSPMPSCTPSTMASAPGCTSDESLLHRVVNDVSGASPDRSSARVRAIPWRMIGRSASSTANRRKLRTANDVRRAPRNPNVREVDAFEVADHADRRTVAPSGDQARGDRPITGASEPVTQAFDEPIEVVPRRSSVVMWSHRTGWRSGEDGQVRRRALRHTAVGSVSRRVPIAMRVRCIASDGSIVSSP